MHIFSKSESQTQPIHIFSNSALFYPGFMQNYEEEAEGGGRRPAQTVSHSSSRGGEHGSVRLLTVLSQNQLAFVSNKKLLSSSEMTFLFNVSMKFLL